MHGIRSVGTGLILLGVSALAFGLMLAPLGAASRITASAAQIANPETVPAFHKVIPEGSLPATMDPALFENPTVRKAYSVAAHIKKMLYQEPCYCYCDRNDGHGSLLDCFVNNHTAGCGVCLKEVFYVYEQSHKGKTAAQIREEIIHGAWKQVDLNKYTSPSPAQ